MNVAGWVEVNGRAVDGVWHPLAHRLPGRPALAPRLVDGLTWARLVETLEATSGVRAPEGVTEATCTTGPPCSPLDGVDASRMATEDVYGGALALAADDTRLVARVDGARPEARWTFYAPGVHVPAFTGDECDHLERLADLYARPQPPGEPALARIVNAGEGAWVHERVGRVVELANAAWWRYELTETGDAHVLDYRPGDAVAEHTDASPMFPARKLSAVVMLSDPADYAGGWLELLHDPVATSPPPARGTVVVFPSTLLHRVTPVTAGRRLSLTVFVHGPPLR